MPFYVYRPSSTRQCDDCEGGFEFLQKLDDEPLDCCPECGAPVEKLITAANLASSAPSLKEDNIEKHGFSQYRKVEKGVYEKTVGKGPGIISSKESLKKDPG